jgi:ABC-2 type transport system ATP-binding protein
VSPVIETLELTKRYGNVPVVDRLSLTVDKGEIFGLLGPNGAGKTTTILMLLGLTEASSGMVRVLGYDPQREPLAVKRRVGYLPDAVGFYDHMTAFENLTYTARLLGIPKAARELRIMQGIERVRLADVAHRRVGTFSRGMRQRLGLAEIILKQAEIAILDEPTSGLDPQSTEELLELIRALKQDGVTILLSSHLLDRVQRVCDRVALFNRGRIALLGTVPELARTVLGGGFAVDVEATGKNLVPALGAIPGVHNVEQVDPERYRLLATGDVRAEVARAVVKTGADLRHLSVEEPSLDAIYSRYFENIAGNDVERRHAA